MAYQSWSVVFSEQPSTAKWNILGTNDASFNDGTGIGTGAILPSSLSSTSIKGATGINVSPLTSTSATDVAGSSVTFTTTVASYMWITFGGQSQINIVDRQYLGINVDGVDMLTVNAYSQSGSEQDIGITGLYKATLTAGSHTIKLRIRCANTPANNAITGVGWIGHLTSQ